MPLPVRGGPKRKRFYDSMPRSQTEAVARSHTAYSGHSQHENTVTIGVIPGIFKKGLERETMEGDLVFTNTNSTPDNFPSIPDLEAPTMIIINIRNVNQFMRDNTRLAAELFHNILRQTDDQSDMGFLKREHVVFMSRIKTSCWKLYEPFTAAIDSGDEVALHLAYLDIYFASTLWNFFGFALGQISPDLDVAPYAVARKGVVPEALNVFPKSKPGDDLYIIFKSYPDELTGMSCFQYIPWAGENLPTMKERFYMDFTGNECYGYVMRIGRAMWHNRGGSKNLPLDTIQRYCGLKDPKPMQRFVRPLQSEIKVALTPPPGSKTYWLF
jgi:hypothetical protein